MEHSLSFKLLLIGDSAVGKTCMLLKYCDNCFQHDHMSTIGVDFKIKRVEHEGRTVNLNIWDTAGQERFRHVTKSFYKGADGIIVCYALDDRQSFEHVEAWLAQIKELADDRVRIMVVGNKKDVELRKVSAEEGRELAARMGLGFGECSARTGEGLETAFEELVRGLVWREGEGARRVMSLVEEGEIRGKGGCNC